MKNLQKSTIRALFVTIAYISLPVCLANARFTPSFSCLTSESSEIVRTNPLYNPISIKKAYNNFEEYSLSSKSSEIVRSNPVYNPIGDQENDFRDYLVSKGIVSKVKGAFIRVFDKNYQYKKTLPLGGESEDSINIKRKSKNSPLLQDAEDDWSSLSSSSSTRSWESEGDAWGLWD